MGRGVVISCFGLLLVLQANAHAIQRGVTLGPDTTDMHPKNKTASLVKINPPLEDVASDKKFFGPPFPADYPDDKRPTVSPSIAWQLKEENKPYPYLQSRHEFDKDYVKDENSDRGDWKAQFDYDAYRRKLAKEESDVKRAQEKADKEGRDVSDAEKELDEAKKNERDAKKNADDAASANNAADKDAAGKDGGVDGGVDGSSGDGISAEDKEKLETLRKKVADATEKYEKEKKEFEECKRQLEKAKQELDDAYQKASEHEKIFASHTKLWAESRESKKKARQAKREAAAVAKKAKVQAAEKKLEAAMKIKIHMDETFAKEKVDNEIAQKTLLKHKTLYDQAEKHLEESRLHLQKLRGHKTSESIPAKSGASWLASFKSICLPFLMLTVSSVV